MSTKCLMLAMSGVRIKSDELRSIGVTLPGFIERGRTIASLPSLGLLTLASFCPEDWHVEYKEIRDTLTDDIRPEDYDIVAISFLTAQAYIAYDVADELRAKGITVVMGGLHASALPDEAQEHADCVVVGEGEYAWQKLCVDFDKGEMKSRYYAQAFGAFDFKDARVPRYDLLDMDKYNRITIQTQRGCPRKCNFCAASHTISNYKCKPIEQVMKEIDEISKHWPHPFIELADDNTFLNRRWAKELVKGIGSRKIRWFTESDISVALDDEMLELISASGCYQILIGLESPNPGALAEADPMGWKQKQLVTYKDAINKIQSYGISVNGCFIMGWENCTKDSFQATKDFVEELGLAEVQVTLLTPFPNTVMYHQMKAKGQLIKDKFWDQCTLFDLTFIPKHMEPREMEEEFQNLMIDLYSAESTNRRKKIFRECVRRKHQLKRSSSIAKNKVSSLMKQKQRAEVAS